MISCRRHRRVHNQFIGDLLKNIYYTYTYIYIYSYVPTQRVPPLLYFKKKWVRRDHKYLKGYSVIVKQAINKHVFCTSSSGTRSACEKNFEYKPILHLRNRFIIICN